MPDEHQRTNRAAWNHQARLALPHDTPQRNPTLEWTQFPGLGPDIDLLGDLHGSVAVELGCGNGDNAAALAAAGARVTGVDISPEQLTRARTRWPDSTTTWHLGTATQWLTAPGPPLDLVVSVFGALEFSPPRPLLDHITARLAPSGRLAFSTAHPRWLLDGGRALHHNDGTTTPVHRNNLDTNQWHRHLIAASLRPVRTIVVADPTTDQVACSIIIAMSSA